MSRASELYEKVNFPITNHNKSFASKMLWLSLIFVLYCPRLVYATDYYVNSTLTTGVCVANNCPNIASALALAVDNDKIFLYPGLFSGSNNTNLCSSFFCSFFNVSLVGLGAAEDVVISGSGSSGYARGLNVSAGSFSHLSNLTFTGFSLDTAARTVITTRSTSLGGAALFIDNSQLSLNSVIVSNSTALFGGGALVTGSDIKLSSCVIEGNRATSYGGGIVVLASNVSLINTVFSSNNVTSSNDDLTGSGGGMHFSGTQLQKLYISQCTFLNNTAQRSGGALHLEPSGLVAGSGFVDILDSKFISNGITGLASCLTASACNSMGGAVYLSAANSTVARSIFSNNYALVMTTSDVGQGGAIFSTTIYISKTKSTFTVSNSNFTSNEAVGSGGALYISNQRFVIQASTFVSNQVFTSDPSFSTTPSLGGALWISNSGLIGSIQSSTFYRNIAKSGWGGALYGTSLSTINILDATFLENSATSSYTNSALGGAVTVTDQAVVTIDSSSFIGNFARPNFTTNPLTYSGAGGAIFAQSVSLYINGSSFKANGAFTGQFDAGSTGGAIVLEDCDPMTISYSSFTANFASGYFGTSSYASSGTGGALYIKFSVADFNECDFQLNWVSAGGSSNSLGGAMAVFFDYSSVADSTAGVQINNTRFLNNSAFGELCEPSQAGSGGAIGFVGIANPTVALHNVRFDTNIAAKSDTNRAVSLGGAISVSLSSNISLFDSSFTSNLAIYGVGHDVASISSTTDDSNYLNFQRIEFYPDTASLSSRLDAVQNRSSQLCNTLSSVVASFTNSYSGYSAQKGVASFATHLHHHPRRLEEMNLMDVDQVPNHAMKKIMYDAMKRRTSISASAQYSPTNEIWRLSPAKPLLSQVFASTDDSTSSDLLDFLPGIALTAGASTLQDCVFHDQYHMFIGNYEAYIDAQTSTSTSTTTISSQTSQISILGNSTGSDGLALTLLAASATVDLYDEDNTISFRQINVFNGTISFSCGININESSFMYNAQLQGIASQYWNSTTDSNEINHPTINCLGDVLTGYTLQEALNSNQQSWLSILHVHNNSAVSNSSAQAVLSFDACDVLITGALYVDSPYRGLDVYVNASDQLASFANCKMLLHNNASIIVAETGSLFLLTSTSVVADAIDAPGITNRGNISLLGASLNALSRNLFIDSTSGNVGSLNSILTVYGNFVQEGSGTLNLILNTTAQNTPVVNLVNNYYFGGQIRVNFSGDPNLVLYDVAIPSTFSIISYSNASASSLSSTATTGYTPAIIAPPGLGFDDQLTYSSFSNNYEQSLVVDSIACPKIDSYYQGISGSASNSLYPCFVCLQNSSCEQCGNQMCSAKGTCGAYGGVKYSSSCCTSSCNPPYGNCEGNNGNTDFSCKCTGWFYKGTNCDELSLTASVIIFTGTFLVTTAILILILYRRSLTQKQQVLEELREGILRHTESANNEYILNMQQALILNDVFVKYEEIKLESKVGEGSFGVVHKATFRGAQVAVKQMRSMFFELTDKEIEEFRREAYVMSRLRHPNIVLVMGISLVDQEPVAYPKTRTVNSCEEDAVSDKKKTKPQKTVCIITEYLEQGSLADILYGPTRLPAEIWTYELILACALQAARGMLYLHSHQPPICHRDLKSSNLVVDDHWVVKVTDFGMSRIVPEKVLELEKGIGDEERESIGRDSVGDFSHGDSASTGSILVTSGTNSSAGKKSQQSQARSSWSAVAPEMTSNMGTTAWCAPEILTASSRTRYSVKVDVYSFGMVLWELWEKKRPFDEYSSRFDIMDAVRAGKRPIISDNCPPAYKALIQRCWHTEPSRRPMFHYIVRYLKDELARVKRQKALPSNSNANTTTRASGSLFRPSSSSFSQPFGGGAAASYGLGTNAIQVLPNAGAVKRASIPTPATILSPSELHQVPPGRSSIISPLHPTNQNEEHKVGELEEIKFPEGRTPLVKAFDRSLSYLTESPALDSPYLGKQQYGGQGMNPAQLYGASNRGLHSIQENPTPSNFDSNNGYASTGRMSQQNNWRDRYVMKFSGWNSAKPDTGLPPAYSQGAASSPSPMNSPLMSSTMHSSMGGSHEEHSMARSSQGVPIVPPQQHSTTQTNAAKADSVVGESPAQVSSVDSSSSSVFKLDMDLRDGLLPDKNDTS